MIMHSTRRLVFALLATLLVSFAPIPLNKITVYMIGDSTMADKAFKEYPETGWGMPFHYFFGPDARVDNRAKNGRSTRTFIDEGRWKAVTDALKPGDYVLIQFGHNDEVPTKRSYTTPEEFTRNLTRFVQDTRAKKAHPILLTPVTRRSFDSAGVLIDTHARYAELTRQVALKYHVPLIDADSESMALVKRFGPERSKYLYDYVAPGENLNFPEGHEDNTHFSELGARMIAEIVARDIRTVAPGLAAYLRDEDPAGHSHHQSTR
jgi:lysophospholipase L1-like esterase